MGPFTFLLAVWALLLTPGPTNTLLALSGASAGLARSVRLMPAEVAAYLLVTVPLAVFGAEVLAREPLLASAVKLAAAGWVAWLAVKLWRVRTGEADAATVTARRVFVTTLLNPKGLIIGLTLLPRGTAPEFPLHLGLFAASILGVAAIWAGAGAMLNRGGAQAPVLYRRAAAVWLAVLAVALAGAAIRT